MKLNQIRDVLAVAKFGSLRGASRHIGIAQPAITRSISDIEHELGAPLFERHPKGVRLTHIGEAFIRRASIIETELQETRIEIDQLKGRNTGQVSVAISTAPSIALIPSALNAFRKRYPDALLNVQETLFQPVERDVLDGRIDFYVGALNFPVNIPLLIIEKLFDNQRLVVVRKGHPLMKAKSAQALENARWIRPAFTNRRSESDFVDMLIKAGLPQPEVVLHTSSILQTVIALTTSDLLSVVPMQWLQLPELAGQLDTLPYVRPIPAAPVCVIRPNGIPLAPLAEHLYDIIQRISATYARAHPLN